VIKVGLLEQGEQLKTGGLHRRMKLLVHQPLGALHQVWVMRSMASLVYSSCTLMAVLLWMWPTPGVQAISITVCPDNWRSLMLPYVLRQQGLLCLTLSSCMQNDYARQGHHQVRASGTMRRRQTDQRTLMHWHLQQQMADLLS
jgi:hypothetical protein